MFVFSLTLFSSALIPLFKQMGTVQKIIDSLQGLCDDKKAQADMRFEEHSSWLQSEFSQVRALLKGLGLDEPADDVIDGPYAELNPEIQPTQIPTSKSNKRKSPETSTAGSRNSPMSKRSSPSPAFEDLAVDQGLPKDLNKLTKDQILRELEKRGCATMTMKALKRDLVDALKELVVDIALRVSVDSTSAGSGHAVEAEQSLPAPSVETSIEDSAQFKVPSPVEAAKPVEAPAVDLASESPRDPTRKGSHSQMAELRNKVMGGSGVVPVPEASKSAATEFEARQRRHRKSQEIRSQPAAPEVTENVASSTVAQENSSPLDQKEPEASSGSAQKLPFLPVEMPVLMSANSFTDSAPKPVPSSSTSEDTIEVEENSMIVGDEAVENPVDAETPEEAEKAVAEHEEEVLSDNVAEADNIVATADGSDSEASFHSAVASPVKAMENDNSVKTMDTDESSTNEKGDEFQEEERELSLEELTPTLNETYTESKDQKPDESIKAAPAVKSEQTTANNKKPSNLISGSGTMSFLSSSSTSNTTTASKPKPVVIIDVIFSFRFAELMCNSERRSRHCSKLLV